MWCASFLEVYGDYPESVKSALTWLTEQRHDDGSWGQTERDIGRITVTGQMLYFLPQLASKSSLKWLEKKWLQELEINPGLTYKGAFTLMAFKRNDYQPTDSQLISQTIQWLEAQQNDDFGWGPWKGHSVGSDPWCTGITMEGLLQYPDKVPQKVLGTGFEWLKEKQLPNGLWPYHYIEEGSSWALYALTKGSSFLSGGKRK
jgi:squalene cyclase